MEHLALEVFDLPTKENPNPTGSQYAVLEPDATITITDTSEIFSNGDVWSYDFTLNVHANAHLFGTAGDIHGSRLHEQINKRKARLWVEGTPLYLGYLTLGSEAEVDAKGNVDVSFESGQKTFEEMIEGTSAQEVSVGDVVIGVALNRKRVSKIDIKSITYNLKGLEAFVANYPQLKDAYEFSRYQINQITGETPYTQQWPKLVKSKGTFLDSNGAAFTRDYTNIQTPYDDGHPFCNINICYPYKSLDPSGEEKSGRGYTMRLAYSDADTTDGSDNQTRFNNAPNFYLLHFVKRLFKDLGIHIEENEMENVEDLRRVFMLNFGCHYEEIENASLGNGVNYLDTPDHLTPSELIPRYGQYYIQIISEDDRHSLIQGWDSAGQYTYDDKKGLEHKGKVLMRNFRATLNGSTYLEIGSVEGLVNTVQEKDTYLLKQVLRLDKNNIENRGHGENGYYSAYEAYATGRNYPSVEISEIIEAMKSMFGVRLLFSDDYKRVRIILLRNVFRSQEVQEISCDIVDDDVKVENNIRGFRMTYGKGTEDTSYYYKGFNDLFPRQSTTWKDTTDKHDYTQWNLNADYATIKQGVSPSNKVCYVTPVNGDAYGVKVDEDEDVLFPSLFGLADFMDAEDGDCSGEKETTHEVQCGASPVIMNDVNDRYAVLFSGDLSAPSPEIDGTSKETIDTSWDKEKWRSTYARVLENQSTQWSFSTSSGELIIQGNLDVYISEGFRIRLLDNYSIGNGGTPFDEADPGLQFGIMRSSGSNAHVRYFDDPDDDENGELDTWEVVPGDGAIDHPDTCDNYGNLWNYALEAGRTELVEYLQNAGWSVSAGPDGKASCTYHYILNGINFLCTPIKNTRPGRRPDSNPVLTKAELEAYVTDLWNNFGWNFGEHDVWQLVLSAKTANEQTAYANGRFSLKLRAEKPNPYYNPKQPESDSNRRYLEITNKNLRQRGLCDQFYKEYSYWVRNARIVKRTVRMTLAQLLTIDKAKRVRVGDVTGFIRKMQYSVSNETGLGNVVMEIMYI